MTKQRLPLLAGWLVASTMLGAPAVNAATGEESAQDRLWTTINNVGTLYSVLGRQLMDNVTSNYIQLAGGDPDDLEVPEAIIADGFLDTT